MTSFVAGLFVLSGVIILAPILLVSAAIAICIILVSLLFVIPFVIIKCVDDKNKQIGDFQNDIDRFEEMDD
jgi:ABC-type transport system involved in cytochrome bd biosynthesis fused ATPase/permease subunit